MGEDFETGEAESLEGVRRGARLVGPAAEEAHAGGLELLSDSEALLFSFDGTGASYHGDVSATDEDVAGGSWNFNDGVFCFDVTGNEFVGLGDGNTFDNTWHGFEEAEINGAGIAGDTDGGPGGAGDGVGFHAEGVDAIADGANLFLGGVGLHNNKHGRRPR